MLEIPNGAKQVLSFAVARKSQVNLHHLPHSALDSHVTKTGDIKDFVVTEESGIAKGIRRIVAVTGQEAQDVTRLTNSLRDRLENLERLSGKEKDAGLKTFSVVRINSTSLRSPLMFLEQELGQAEISVLRKAELKDRLTAIRKAFDKQAKEKEAAANKEVSSSRLIC
jgi:alanyl-tRNA synthetase